MTFAADMLFIPSFAKVGSAYVAICMLCSRHWSDKLFVLIWSLEELDYSLLKQFTVIVEPLSILFKVSLVREKLSIGRNFFSAPENWNNLIYGLVLM